MAWKDSGSRKELRGLPPEDPFPAVDVLKTRLLLFLLPRPAPRPGGERILRSGFVATAQPHSFGMQGYALTFLVDADIIFGLTLEKR
ncbi:MAG TPA: hypothetical protein VNX25_00900 [Verrucomicrobiae bacterium]|nr:hypothetical protein [Verrucomicrobiae bacterium]